MPEDIPEAPVALTNDEIADRACDWSDYRKAYGERHPGDVYVFKAGWDAGYDLARRRAEATPRPTLDDQGRVIVGTTYLAPSGDIYRLRGYGADWSAEPFTGEQTLPDYSVQWVSGMMSAGRTLPEGSVIIWAPRPMRVGDRVVHRNLDLDRSVVYGHVTRVRDDELMTEVKWADGSGPTWHRTFDLQHAEEARHA